MFSHQDSAEVGGAGRNLVSKQMSKPIPCTHDGELLLEGAQAGIMQARAATFQAMLMALLISSVSLSVAVMQAAEAHPPSTQLQWLLLHKHHPFCALRRSALHSGAPQVRHCIRQQLLGCC